MAPGAICMEPAFSGSIQITFRKYASRRISGTNEQNIEDAFTHDLLAAAWMVADDVDYTLLRCAACAGVYGLRFFG